MGERGQRRSNLSADNSMWDFDSVKSAANATWNQYLNKIQIAGGSATEQQLFYTSLYHSLLHPNVFSDTNGEYIGFDHEDTAPSRVLSRHSMPTSRDGTFCRRQVQLQSALVAPQQMARLGAIDWSMTPPRTTASCPNGRSPTPRRTAWSVTPPTASSAATTLSARRASTRRRRSTTWSTRRAPPTTFVRVFPTIWAWGTCPTTVAMDAATTMARSRLCSSTPRPISRSPSSRRRSATRATPIRDSGREVAELAEHLQPCDGPLHTQASERHFRPGHRPD